MAAGGGQDPVRRVVNLEAVGRGPALEGGSVTAAGRPDRRGSNVGAHLGHLAAAI